MSYLVFARKWRPAQFKDVVAQDHVTTTLSNAIEHDRLASAYLFSGPRGIGKTTTARIFAKAINCESGPTPTPCNTCSSCSEITGSRSLEVFEIDGASNRGIDEVRNLRENLKYAASKGKYKIYIIDEVHMLTTEAFNALLKSLEEPPPRVLFIFATTETHKVPATILSRCQRYDFRRIPIEDIVAQLQKIAASESIQIDEKALYLIAKKSEGSLRDSQSLLDQAVSFCGEKVDTEALSELLGIIDQELFFQSTDCIAKKDTLGVLKLVETIFEQGYDIAEFLNGLIEHFRNVLVAKTTGRADLLEGLESYAARFEETSRPFSEMDLLRFINLSTETGSQIKLSTNPKLLLEVLLVKLIKMEKSVELSQLLSHIENLKPEPGARSDQASHSAAQPASKSENPGSSHRGEAKTVAANGTSNKLSHGSSRSNGGAPAVPIVKGIRSSRDKGVSSAVSGQTMESDGARVASLGKIKEKWTDIIDEVRNKKIHLGSFLNEGYPTSIDDGSLEISFGKENGFHINTINQNRRLIQEVIASQTGFVLAIFCKKNESAEFKEIIAKHRPESEPHTQPDDENLLQIPIVKRVIELFDGEIVTR